VPTNIMPGFTAEASDYVSERGYSSPVGAPGRAVASGVFPSLVAPISTGIYPWWLWTCCPPTPKTRGRAMRASANAGAPMTDQDFCDAIGGGMMTTSSGGTVCVLAGNL
jgi:hypothetical protein